MDAERQANRIRALAESMHYADKTRKEQKLIRLVIEADLCCPRVAINSALRHGSKIGRPVTGAKARVVELERAARLVIDTWNNPGRSRWIWHKNVNSAVAELELVLNTIANKGTQS